MLAFEQEGGMHEVVYSVVTKNKRLLILERSDFFLRM
jgi:hypothetical protein